MVDDGRRTPDHGHPISSPCEPDGSGELKMGCSASNQSVKLQGPVYIMRFQNRNLKYHTCKQILKLTCAGQELEFIPNHMQNHIKSYINENFSVL